VVRSLDVPAVLLLPFELPVYEAVVRLDRIQAVIPHYPGWEPTGKALSGEALGVLMGMLREYFGAPQGHKDGLMNTCGFSPEGSSSIRTWMP